MKVLFEGGEPTIVGTTGGDTFYVQDGRAMLRQRVTAIRPNSAAAMSEVSTTVSAAKRFSNTMTDAERDAWAAFAPVEVSAFDIYSLF